MPALSKLLPCSTDREVLLHVHDLPLECKQSLIKEIPIIVEPLKLNPDLDQVTKGKYFKIEDLALNKTSKRIMYVVSPAFPPMNTTYNVSDSQLRIIESYLTEAFKTVRIIIYGELDW